MLADQQTHHDFGPSSFLRRQRCPGSLREESVLPDVSSDDAEEGTRLHAVIAKALEDKLAPASDDDLEIVERCFDFLNEHVGRDWDSWTGQIEWRVNGPGFFGTPDLVVYDEESRVVHVVNWKTGHKELVPAELTHQISLECVLALTAFPGAVEARGFAFNPRLREHAQGRLTRFEMPEVIEIFRDVRAACERVDSPLETGTHCRYCRALGVCSATQETAELAIREVDAVDEVKRWPVERLAQVADKLPLLEQICKAVRARIHDVLEQEPDCLPGWERTERGSVRSADPRELIAAVSDVLTPEDVVAHCSVSVAGVERSWTEKWREENGGSKKAAQDAFREATRDVVRQGTTHALKRTSR